MLSWRRSFILRSPDLQLLHGRYRTGVCSVGTDQTPNVHSGAAMERVYSGASQWIPIQSLLRFVSPLVLRQNHKAGDRLYVDYLGKKPSVVDPDTGEARTVELFVAVLGASNYLYAEVTETQKASDFCGSIQWTLEFLGVCPE